MHFANFTSSLWFLFLQFLLFGLFVWVWVYLVIPFAELATRTAAVLQQQHTSISPRFVDPSPHFWVSVLDNPVLVCWSTENSFCSWLLVASACMSLHWGCATVFWRTLLLRVYPMFMYFGSPLVHSIHLTLYFINTCVRRCTK